MTIYQVPENEQFCDYLYAFLSYDENGEGIFALTVDDIHVPFVFGNKKIIEFMKKHIIKAVKDTDKPIHLVRFKRDEILEEFKP